MDIWEKLQTVESDLAARKKYIHSIAHSFPDPILIIDRYGKCLETIGGKERSPYHSGYHLIGKYIHDVLPEEHADSCIQTITEAIEENSLKTVEYMLGPEDVVFSSIDSPMGKQWFEARVYPIPETNDEAQAVIWIPINITLRKNLEEQVKNLSEKDPLTEAYNRKHFLQIFEKEFSIAKRYKNRFSVLLIDIDNFKEINDKFGHKTGDTLLKQFAAYCETIFRSSDLFARYVGESFIAFLPNTPSLGAAIIAERIRGNSEKLEIKEGNETIRFTVSIGISQIRDTDENSNAILARADGALYRAKTKGRNRSEIS